MGDQFTARLAFGVRWLASALKAAASRRTPKASSAFLIALIPLAALAAESELHYRMPEGWANVMSPSFIASDVPQSVMAQVASGKYAL